MTEEQFQALVDLIDTRIQIGIVLAAHPADRSRNAALLRDLRDNAEECREALVDVKLEDIL